MKNNLRNYTKQSRGIGDTIAKFTHATGIDRLAKTAAAVVGKKDCGCGARKEALNKAFPYKNK
tara:strand:+ start:65 stop:253 length:189 start_codon:yes stop_codon:yes gene_type:complete